MYLNRTVLILLILSIISCKETINLNKKKNTNLFEKVNLSNSKILDVKFPDTVFLKSYVKGAIKYNLKIDSIDRSSIKERITILYVSTKSNILNFEDIESNKQGSFIDTIGNGVFIFKVKFSNKGKDTLTLAIKDIVDAGDEISQEYTILKIPVYVKDSI